MVKGLLCLPAQCQAHGEDSRRQESTPGKGGRGGWSTQMSQQQDCCLLLCLEEAGSVLQGSYKMTFNRPTLCIGLPKLSKADLSGQALGFWASTGSFWALLKLNSLHGWADSSWGHDVREQGDGVEGVLMFYGGGSVMVWVGVSLEACTDLHMLDRSTLTAVFHQQEILKPTVRLGLVLHRHLGSFWHHEAMCVCSEFLDHKPINGMNYLSVDTLWHYSFSSVHSKNFDELLISYF